MLGQHGKLSHDAVRHFSKAASALLLGKPDKSGESIELKNRSRKRSLGNSLPGRASKFRVYPYKSLFRSNTGS